MVLAKEDVNTPTSPQINPMAKGVIIWAFKKFPTPESTSEKDNGFGDSGIV
ncbi:hypothetical protein DSO57_1010084 [Entomophthora muscae]|uniref:Uncharacterized protein n=1 Tax=Entomophthora muscae TaxID=34485 RepID=A0ACC2T7J8_9FUNG|nr:hypothetical protein DSO57_1010084 [Entomophthora muscae]